MLLVFWLLSSFLVGYFFTGAAQAGGFVASIFQPLGPTTLLLLPFVVVRAFSANAERAEPTPTDVPSLTRIAAVRVALLLAACVTAWIPIAMAIGVFRAYGGSVRAGEVISVGLGHLLRAGLVVSVAMVFAVANRPRRALILSLAFSLVMLWVDQLGQAQGGLVEQLAQLTPEGMLHAFDRGEIRLDVAYVFGVAVVSNLVIAMLWMHRNLERGYRWAVTAVVLVVSTALTALADGLRESWSLPVSSDAASVSIPSFMELFLFFFLLPTLYAVAWWRWTAATRGP